MTRNRLLFAAAAILVLAGFASAQSLDIPSHAWGLSFGNSKTFDGLRFNYRDRGVVRVRGLNVTLWAPYEKDDNDSLIQGVSLGLIPGGGTLHGLQVGLLGVAGVKNVRGISFGFLGVGTGGSLVGVNVGGLGAGAGGNITGINIGGLGLGAGGNVAGINIGGLGLGAGGEPLRDLDRRARAGRVGRRQGHQHRRPGAGLGQEPVSASISPASGWARAMKSRA